MIQNVPCFLFSFKKKKKKKKKRIAHYTFQTKNREHFESFMKKRKIQINKVFEYSIPHIPRFRQYVNKGESFPNSMVAGNRNVNLPIYPQLIKRPYKLEKIAEAVKSYYEKYD